MVQFQALGGLTVTDGGRELSVGGPRQRRLLAVLLVNRNAVVSVDRLIDAVFAGEPTPAANTTLRSYVARIRKVVSSGSSGAVVVTQAPGYVLRLPAEAFDVARFEQGLSVGRSILDGGEAREAAATLRESLSLWRGDAYEEFADEDWVQPEAQRLGEMRLVAQELLFEAELACGRSAEAIPELESVVGHHPLRERFVGQLMTALYRTGRQADALRAYQRHREVLIEELGLDPTPALQALEGRILDHDPGLVDAGTGQDRLRGYVLGERLGTGREGTVHAAHLPGVERDLVIRVVRPGIADSAAFVRSFESEAHRIASLRHPAIVPIHDYWREPGAAYVVMRRMHGGSLADRLERRDRRPLAVADVTAIVGRVGAALVAAREAGLVHARVDPSSVLFDEGGEAWLSDFALGTGTDQAPEVDVVGLATLVGACLTDPPGPVTDAIERGSSRTDAPSIDQYVPHLLAALTGVPTDVRAPVPNPYKGLRAFDESDAADFFGRTDVVDELVRRLGRHDLGGRLVLVVGGSGTGKSSVVRAGLLPRLRRGEVPGSEQWFLTTMLPGTAPFKELAVALRRVAVSDVLGAADDIADKAGIDAVVRRLLPPGGQLLVIIDQFEELFTSASEAEQRRFLDGLMDAVSRPDSRVRVVGTLRADFYDRPLAFQPFGSAVNDATVTIPAMSPAELEAAIVEPAEQAGRHVDQALLAELVSAADDEPAGLPALQFTLFELAERSAGDLTLDAYRQLGGMTGSIASRAESLYRSLDDDDERAAVRRLFQQLVVVNADGESTRRRARRTELIGHDPGLDAVIDRWADARLLSLDRHRQSRVPTVEPAHEALLREWPRLRRWIDEDRDALMLLGRLRESAASWVELDRDPGALYRGARLQVALDTLGTEPITSLEREFLDVSAEARDAEAHEAEDRIEQAATANRRLRRQLVVIGVALLVALAGGFVAVDQRSEALDERQVAFVRELAAAADASLGEDPERAMLLALEAIAASDPSDTSARPEAIGALHDALSRSRLVLTVPGVGGDLDWSPDGSVFITEGPDETGLVDLRDARTGESVRSWTGHEVDVNDVAFSADGRQFATGGDDGYLRVWDTSSGDLVGELEHDGAESASAMSFSPDGRHVVGTWTDVGQTVVFDIRSGEAVAVVTLPSVHGAAFSPDGGMLALAALDRGESGILVVDPRTGVELHRVGTDTDSAQDARFSPDGRWLASAHQDGLVRVWSAVDFGLRSTIAGHASEATSVAWSPDSARLATSGNDGTARVHDLIPGGTREAVVVSGRDTANGIPVVKFSSDGRRIMTSDWTIASVQVWDVTETAGGELASIRGAHATAGSGSGSFLPDGRGILAVDRAGDAGLWGPDSGARLANLDIGAGPDEWIGLAVSPDGSILATITDWGVRLWDLESGERVADVGAFADSLLRDMAWSADSEHLAIAHQGDEGVVTVVDRTGTAVAEVAGGESWDHVGSLAFIGDTDELAMVTVPARPTREHLGIQAWDWRRDEITLQVGTLAEEVAADPTSSRVVATELLSGAAHIYDMATGERLQTLRGAGTVRSVTYSADGERVALGSADGTVRVFDAETGRLELNLRGHDQAVTSASFSPDGTKLSTADVSGMVRVWALDVDQLMAIAHSRLTRGLDDDECRQYLRLASCAGA